MQRTPVQEVDAAEALAMLSKRWEQRRSVREAFLSLDRDCDGVISPSELRASVDALGVRLPGPEFRKLWRSLDAAGEGRLTHAAFNRVVGPLLFPSSWGFSATMNRPVTPPLSPSGEAVLGQSVRRKVQDAEAVWRELDLYSAGTIRHSEFIQGLRMLGIRMSDATVFALMKRFAGPRNASGDMTRDEFLACMAYLRDSVPEPASARDEAAHAALLAAAEAEVARVLPHASKARMLGALAPFDTAGTGVLSYGDFAAMLQELGAAGLGAEHYAALCERYDDGGGEPGIDLRNFAGVFIGAHGGEGGALAGAAGGAGSSSSSSSSSGGGGIGGASLGHASHRHHHATSGELEDRDGGLGLGGPHAEALIKRNTEGTYPSLLASRKGYPPWAAVGIRPLMDPLTMQPTTLDKLARLAMARTGLSEGESRAVLCMVGRRSAIAAALARADKGATGALPKHAFRDLLAQQFDVAMDASCVDLLAYRFDPEHKGRAIFYGEFLSAMARVLDAPYHPTNSPLALAQIGMEAIPGAVLVKPATPGGGGGGGGGGGALSPLQLAMAGSPLAGLDAGAAGRGGGSEAAGAPVVPDPFNAHWREKEGVRGGGGGGGASASSASPRLVSHASGGEGTGSSSSSSAAASAAASPPHAYAPSASGGSEDSEAVEGVLARLRSALGRGGKWAALAHGCASHMEAATSPLAQAGRAGVSADLGSPLRLSLSGAAGGGGGSASKRAGGGAEQGGTLLDRTLQLGAAARGGGGGGGGGGSGGSVAGSSSSSGNSGGLRGGVSASLGRTTVPLRRVPVSLLQRVLAQAGVGVTPRELRQLSGRYGNAGREGSEPLHVDLEALIRENQ